MAQRINEQFEVLNADAAADPGAVYFAFSTAPEDLGAVLAAFGQHHDLWTAFQALLPSLDAAGALRGRLVRLAREAGEVWDAIEMLEVLYDVDAPADVFGGQQFLGPWE